jgi:hypothetical protein
VALIKGSRQVGLGARNTRMRLLAAFEDARILQFPATTHVPKSQELQYVVQIGGVERVLDGPEVEPFIVGVYDALRLIVDPRAKAVAGIVEDLTAEADRLPEST